MKRKCGRLSSTVPGSPLHTGEACNILSRGRRCVPVRCRLLPQCNRAKVSQVHTGVPYHSPTHHSPTACVRHAFAIPQLQHHTRHPPVLHKVCHVVHEVQHMVLVRVLLLLPLLLLSVLPLLLRLPPVPRSASARLRPRSPLPLPLAPLPPPLPRLLLERLPAPCGAPCGFRVQPLRRPHLQGGAGCTWILSRFAPQTNAHLGADAGAGCTLVITGQWPPLYLKYRS